MDQIVGREGKRLNEGEARAMHELSGRLSRLEALQEANGRANHELAAGMNRLTEKLERSDAIAREANQRARAAHHRIDETRADSDKKWSGLQDNLEWLWRTVLTAVIVGVLGGAATFVWNRIGGG